MAKIILGNWAGTAVNVDAEVRNQHETKWRDENWQEGDATVEYGADPARTIPVRKINSSPEVWAEIEKQGK